jgi:hypothetical protein
MTYDPAIKHKNLSGEGRFSESYLCVDCGFNTAPGCPDRKQADAEILLCGKSTAVFTKESETYPVKDTIWERADMEPWGRQPTQRQRA